MMSLQVIGAYFLAVTSGATMMLCFRYVSSMSPFFVNAIANFIAGIICLVFWFYMGEKHAGIAIHSALIILGVSMACLNISYVLLYSAKVPTAYAPIIITGVMTVLLGIAGWQLFGELITAKFVVGSVLILVGMIVMVVW